MTPPGLAASEGFVAACRGCGAPLALVLGMPVTPCRYCRVAQPLSAEVLARLEEAARIVGRAAAREHRRRLRHRIELETYVVLGVMGAGAAWLLLGGFAFYLAARALEPDVGVYRALSNARAGAESAGATWALFALLLGAAVALSAFLVPLARLRRAGGWPLALPPLAAGAYRCHLCGAALPGTGATRACTSCGARNLIDARALAAHSADLVQHIEELRAHEAMAANDALDATESASIFAALFPLFAPVVAYPLGELLGVWSPYALIAIPIALLPALIAALRMAGSPPLTAQSFAQARPNDAVRVDGRAYRVLGVLRLTPDAPPEHLLAPEGSLEPTLSLRVQELPDDRIVACTVERSGAPLPLGMESQLIASMVELAPEALASLRARHAGPALVVSGTTLQAASLTEELGQRVFSAGSAAGAVPLWTLRKVSIPPTTAFLP